MGKQVTATYRQYLALFCVVALLCPSLSACCCSELEDNKHSTGSMHASAQSSDNPSMTYQPFMTHQPQMLDDMAMAQHATDTALDIHSGMVSDGCCDHTTCDGAGCSAPVGLHVLSAFNEGLILAGVPYLADTSSPHFRERGTLLRPPISA